MPALARHSSSSSILSMVTTASSDTAVSDSSGEALTRKRPSPAQLDALQTTFEDKPYLTRGERVALAEATGMELKAVTAWFQNKRQAAKRVSGPTHATRTIYSNLDVPRPRARGPASLDHIATLAEWRSGRSRRHTMISSTISDTASVLSGDTLTPPMSPDLDQPNASRGTTPEHLEKQHIWQFLDSTFTAATAADRPSSPVAERARFSVLRADARSLRSLEYACAKARAPTLFVVEEAKPAPVVLEEQLRHPKSGHAPIAVPRKKLSKKEKENTPQSEGDNTQDVEAAILLMHFQKTRV